MNDVDWWNRVNIHVATNQMSVMTFPGDFGHTKAFIQPKVLWIISFGYYQQDIFRMEFVAYFARDFIVINWLFVQVFL